MIPNNESTLINLLLCGLLGILGQGIRVIIGLKKLREEATNVAANEAQAGNPLSQAKTVYNNLFDARQLWLSLFIGFIAGCLASLADNNPVNIASSREAQMAIVAAGYAGTDFIEGLFKKMLPGS